MTFCYINGNFIESENAKISIKDRGLRFGDGVFETIRLKNGELKHIEKHLKRLSEGLEAINIQLEENKINSLHEILLELANKNKVTNGFARVMITRGNGSRGYMPTYESKPSIIAEIMPEREMNFDNIKLCISEYRKIPLECLPSNYKIMNGLNYSLTKESAKKRGFFDAIMLTIDGYVSECSSSNIFWKKGDRFYTPSLETGCLKGITREVFIEENKDTIVEGKFKLEELKTADEIYICNVLIGFRKVLEVIYS